MSKLFHPSYKNVFCVFALIAVGFAAGTWVFWEPADPSKASPNVSIEVREPEPPKQNVDPTIQLQSLAEHISHLDEMIRKLDRENENLDQLIVAYQKPPEYRMSFDEISSRGSQTRSLSQEKNYNVQLRNDYQRMLRSSRREYQQLQLDQDVR